MKTKLKYIVAALLLVPALVILNANFSETTKLDTSTLVACKDC